MGALKCIYLRSWKYRFHWKLQSGKGIISKIYLHFWRKRMMKRINEVSRKIAESHPFTQVMDKPNYDLSMPADMVKPVSLAAPLGWVPPVHHILTNHGQNIFVPPPAGVCVMDPTKIYNILPKQMTPEWPEIRPIDINLPVIRRRICHLRRNKVWKYHTRPC